MAKRRRIKVAGRDAYVVTGLALAAGVLTVMAGPSPTGATAIDAVLVFLGAAATVWAAASAPWWAGVVMAAVAATMAPEWWLLAIAAGAAAIGLAIGLTKRSLAWQRALIAAAAIVVLARLGNVGFFGLTSLVAISMSAMVAILGVRRRSRTERRIARWVVVGVGIAGGLALLGFALGAATARPDLEEGSRQARSGIALLGEGKIDDAEAAFTSAGRAFRRADTDLGRPWVQPSRLVPIAAQHRRSATELTDGAARASQTISQALAAVDLDALQVIDGRIDIAAIYALEAPLTELNAALDELDRAIGRSASPWLVAPVQRRLDDLADDIAKQQVQGANALTAVQQAPAMLGGSGPRVYFVAFTTPAEARGLGGFMGNWAELTITNGRLAMTAFGRTDDLNEGGDPAAKRLTGPQEFLERYGRFEFITPPDGRVGPKAWSDLTLDPHFPNVAEVIAQLYPVSGGRSVDGVIAMDVYALATLMELTGPVPIAGEAEPLTADNAAAYLLYDQYLLADNDERIDVLENVALTTFDRLLTTTLPGPADLAKLLGPMAAEGRLVAWARRAEEEAVFTGANMSGALPPLNGGDGFGVTINNGVGNKIDSYLDGTVTYTALPDPETGRLTSEAVITLENSAPATGLPDYVIGNVVGLPTGINRTYLSIFSAIPYSSVTVDGVPTGFEVEREQGYFVSSTFLDIPAGASAMVRLTFEGQLDLSEGYHLVLRSPPTVRAFPTTVLIGGDEAVPRLIDVAGIHRLVVPL